MIKGFIKTISYVQLVLGIIGSFVIAYFEGKIPEDLYYFSRYHERSIGLTLVSFLASLLSVLILFSFLYGFYTILENQESILYKLSELNNDKNSSRDSFKGFKFKALDETEKKLNANEWRCSICGKINSNSLNFCSCEAPKSLE